MHGSDDTPAAARDGGSPAMDPAGLRSYEEVRLAVLGLIPRGVGTTTAARQIRIGRSTLYDVLAGKRRLTEPTLRLIVTAYDPDRLPEWTEALARALRAEGTEPVPVAGRQASRPADDTPADPVPAPEHPGGRRPRLRRPSPLGVAAVVLAALSGWFAGRADLELPAAEAESARPSSSPFAAAGNGCPQPPLATTAAVVAEPGARSAGVSVVTMSYTYTPAYSPQIEIGGGLSGPLPAGRRLFVLSWADPATQDSTPAHSPGNGRFYPTPQLAPTAHGCFAVPRTEMGYGGFTGMRAREYVALVPDAVAPGFERDGNAKDGYTVNDLARADVQLLAYTVVETATGRP